MHPFEYAAPATLAEALHLMNNGADARPLAGGTDLIDQMRTGRWRPNLLVDVKKLPELNVLSIGDDGLQLGAAVPCYRIYDDSQVVAAYSALSDSARILGGVQIQSRASFGGNLCNSGPAGDSLPSMIALDGVCVIAGASGRREIPVADFCTGPGKNVLGPGELLVEIRFPARPPRSGSHYRRMIPRNEMDIAVVGVAASVTLGEGREIAAARISLGAVAPKPLLAEQAAAALAGKSVDDDAAIELAAREAQAIVSPIDDMRGDVAYRTHVTGVLVRRVVKAAAARALGETFDYRVGG